MAEEPLAPLDSEEEEGGPVKTFLEHLEDLRWVLIRIIASVLVGMFVCMVGAPALIKILMLPLDQAGIPTKIDLFGPMGGFTVWMKIAFWGGICTSLPFILFFIGQFVAPALKKNEKPYFRKAFIIGGGLFFAGVLLCYGWVIPIALRGMMELSKWLGFQGDLWRGEEYIQFVVMFMVGMGLSFEVPVIILSLVKMGIVPHSTLVKGRVYFFVGNMVLCAFITPDAFSTIFMVIPVQILMEICIQISAHWERQKRIAEAKEAAAAVIE